MYRVRNLIEALYGFDGLAKVIHHISMSHDVSIFLDWNFHIVTHIYLINIL
jgi:hypothetical protein